MDVKRKRLFYCVVGVRPVFLALNKPQYVRRQKFPDSNEFLLLKIKTDDESLVKENLSPDTMYVMYAFSKFHNLRLLLKQKRNPNRST